MIRNMLKTMGYLAASIVIAGALLIIAGVLLTPYLNRHLPDFEGWSSQILHVPVKINHVKVSWNMYEPEITFDKVSILDKNTQKPKFSINKIVVNLSIMRSIILWKPIPQSILVSGSRLTIKQPASDKIFIEELKELPITDDSTGAPSTFNEVIAWLFIQPNLTVEKINIDYYLPSGDKKSFTLKQLNLKNYLQQHQLSGHVTLNQDIPTQAQINLKWQGEVTDLEHISANLYLYIEAVSLPQWLSQFSWKNLQIKQGLGSAKIWATWKQNQVQKIQTQFQFYDLDLFSLVTHKNLHVQRMSGQVGWRLVNNKHILAAKDLLIDLSEHLWPTTSFALVFDEANHLESVKTGYLNLADAKEILLTSGLINEEVKKIIIGLNPRGEVHHLSVLLPSDPVKNPTAIHLSSQFSQLSVDPWNQFPGVSKIQGSIDWNGEKGNLTLNSLESGFRWDTLFNNPIHFNHLLGVLQWQKTSDGTWLLGLKNFQIDNADLKFQGGMLLTLPPQNSPVIDFSGDFSLSNLTHIATYLPVKKMDADLVSWLKQAFSQGQLKKGKVVLQGRLSDFPFDQGGGKFVASGVVNDITLQYAPHWPALHHLNGVLTFSGRSMTVQIHSGQIFDMPLTSVYAVIPTLGGVDPAILTVDSEIHSTFTQALAFIQHSPLSTGIGKDLAALDIQGPLQLNLGLKIPLTQPEATKVDGKILMKDISLGLPLSHLVLNHLKGVLTFTEQDIQAQNLTGNLLDEPALLNISTVHEGPKKNFLKAFLQSQLNIALVEKWLQQPIQLYATGVAPYNVTLKLASQDSNQSSEVIIQSDLQGIAIDLPAPYGKKMDAISPLQANLIFKSNQPFITKIQYDKLMSAALSFKNEPAGFQFKKGEVKLGGGDATLPMSDGLYIAAQFKKLDWETLEPYIKWFKEQQQKIKMPTHTSYDFFKGISLSAEQAVFFGQRFDRANFQINKTPNDWQFDINSSQVLGKIRSNLQFSQIKGDFQRFYVASSGSAQSVIDPKTLPAFSLRINDLRYGEMALGDVMVDTAPSAQGLEIREFNMNTGVANLSGTGSWVKNTTHFQGKLSTHNLTRMLTEWQVDATALIGSDAEANFDLNWQDAPYSPSLKSMNGTVALKLGKGRIINLGNSTEAKLGLGRLLNVLSLQSIPQRLSLNFSDLFQNGYSFDSMKGNFKLQNGNAFTEDMHIEGTVASVSIAGRIGLQAKDFDMRLDVTAHVTSSLPIIAAAAINPIAGVATWAVDKIVSTQVSKVTTYKYQVTGPWSNPLWTQINSFPQ